MAWTKIISVVCQWWKKDVQDFFAPDSFSLWLHLPITFQFFVCGSSVGWLQPWGLLLKNACPFHFPLAYLAYFEILSVSSYYTEITFLWCIKGGERGKKASVVFTVKRRKLFLLNLEHFVFPDFFIFFYLESQSCCWVWFIYNFKIPMGFKSSLIFDKAHCSCPTGPWQMIQISLSWIYIQNRQQKRFWCSLQLSL